MGYGEEEREEEASNQAGKCGRSTLLELYEVVGVGGVAVGVQWGELAGA